MAEPNNHNEAGEVAPSTVDQQAPQVSEENAPSTSSPEPTTIPSANAPDPASTAAEQKKPATGSKATPAMEAGAKVAKEKKEKAPAIEDKPFAEFIQQHYIPTLKEALAKTGVLDLTLTFAKQPIPIKGFSDTDCWQVIGIWEGGRRQFNVYFFKEDIQGQRGFSYTASGGKPSTLEPFLIDERKITLDLLVFGVLQRLNAQKWLVRN